MRDSKIEIIRDQQLGDGNFQEEFQTIFGIYKILEKTNTITHINYINFLSHLKHLTLPRRGYRFCGSEGKAPPKKSMIEWSETHVAVDILLRYKFRYHLQKFGLLSQKLTEISRFQNFVKVRFHVTSVYKICHNSLHFEAIGLIFCMQA